MGATNWSSYSNPQFDALLNEALNTVDDAKREALLRNATALALKKDYAIIPLYHQVSTWAARKGLTMVPRVDEFTQAQQVHAEAEDRK